ncbi:uncharacterized protein V6R79_002415 [Siganus canaliculatus]
MRALSVVLVLALCVCRGAVGVQVKVGDRLFPLEAVKQLKDLMDLDGGINHQLSDRSVVVVCNNPLLPQTFLPVCHENGASAVFSELSKTERKEKSERRI